MGRRPDLSGRRRRVMFCARRTGAQNMTGSRRLRWIVVLASSIVLAGALALPAGADPPQDVRPGSGGSPASEIALCCTWGDGIKNGITYSVDAPDTATADAVAAGV